MEPTIRFELMTPSLPWKCSTTELSGLKVLNSSIIHVSMRVLRIKWSGKRDSNPRPSAWKADALAN